MNKKTSKIFAIISTILSVVIFPIGLILGILGLFLCTSEKDKKLSKIAIIISIIVGIIFGIIIFLISLSGGAQPYIG